jgi:3-hydroxyisobutyrate dehydrogenase
MKAFLGMGLLGSNFVRAMIGKGQQVQVWNRTPARAKALEAYGAMAFEDVTDAVTGADIIHLTLKDDESVNQVLAAAELSLLPGTTIIDHTTTSAKGAIERAAYWKSLGFTYLHAPVFMGPPNAFASTGTMLVSGDQDVITRVTPELSAMTGKLMNFGPEEGKAAGIKLIGNLFLLSLTAGLSDTLALAKAQGISVADVSALFDTWNPGAGVPARLKRITEADFANTSWELNMARKDAGLMIAAATDARARLITTPAIAAEMDHWIAKGHGADDWSVIATDSL